METPAAPASKGFSILAENITKTFGETKALSGVTMNFEAGGMHGLIGPEGAGKTTLLRVIVGLLFPQSGNVTYCKDGAKIDFKSIREGVAYMPQTQSLYADLSVDEHLQFFRDLYQIPRRDYFKKRDELMNVTRLGPFANRAAGKLSGGMYKKLGLMCALLRSPQIMLLDEPTNGVDPISRREFWDLLYRLRDQDILIIVTTAYMDEAERCSTVHLLESGQVLAQGDPRAVLAREKVSSFDELFLRHGRKGEVRG